MKPLGEVVTIVMGQSPPSSTYNEVGDGLPFFQGATDFGSRYPSSRVYCSNPKRIAEIGDILLTVRAPIGRLNIADLRCATGRGVAIIRTEDFADQKYLEYCLKYSYRKFKMFEGEGSVFGNIRKADLEKLQIPWYEAYSRHAIAAILGALDDKIELNRKMNRTLEEMAKVLFKSWFVDFDPVRAKMEGRKPFGMDDATAALFPKEFQDSKVGSIPKGWRVGILQEFVDLNPTRRLDNGVEAPYLEMKNMPTDSAVPSEWYKRPAGSGARFINGDTLVAKITPCLENGKTAFVNFLKDREIGWGSTEYIVLRSRPPLPLEFSYLLARTGDFRGFAISNMIGSSGRQRVPPSVLSTYLLCVAPKEILLPFGKQVYSIFRKMRSNLLEILSLTETKDTLLPRLLSGEIRLKDAEKFVGENA